LWHWGDALERGALRLLLGAGILICAHSVTGCCLLTMYMKSFQVRYELPGTDSVLVERDITYKEVDGRAMLLDVYRPPQTSGRLPAVLMVHGSGPQFLVDEAKDWGTFTGFGRIIAASGMVGVAFNHRGSANFSTLQDEASDIEDAVSYVREHADELGVDPDRICLWAFSAGGAYLGRPLRDRPDYLRCVVAYYAVMDLTTIPDLVSDKLTPEQLREHSPVSHLAQDEPPLPPILVAKAGRDREDINGTIDAFVREAARRDLPVELLVHEEGRHGFDVMDDDQRTRAIIERTLAFIAGAVALDGTARDSVDQDGVGGLQESS
jgi:acetyl esterase/lipase